MAELLEYLKRAVEDRASDLFIVAGGCVSEKLDGHIRPLDGQRVLPPDTERLIAEIYRLANRPMDRYRAQGDDDFSFAVPALARFRVNAYRQRGSMAAVVRVVSFEIPDWERLHIPPAVMDLAEAGVIDGMTPNTYSPDTTVTNAQALKLILLAAGYSEPAQTGRHWASGYLTLAAREGLLPTSSTITENNLDNNISRYAIAEIAAKALKLPSSTLTTSPFNDMAMTNASASYVLSLYEAGIVEGTTLSNGQVMYYGVNAIRRSEMATIVWRMYNYKTSNP